MKKSPSALDAITDVVLAYRPAGTGENNAEYGYDKRVSVAELSNFKEQPNG